MRKNAPDLSWSERHDIYLLQSEGKGIREISRLVKRSASTISREFSRYEHFGRWWRRLPWYERARYAQVESLKNRSRERSRGWRLKNERVRQYVHECLTQRKWSPSRIALRIKIELPGESISHEAIYQYIFSVARELIQYLKRCTTKGRQRRSSGKKHRAKDNSNKRRIDQRPAEVETREEFGHNESDLIVSCKGGQSCLLVFVERKTRRVYLRKVANREADTIRRAILEILLLLPAQGRKSLTVDNGKEHEWLPRLEPIFNEDGFLVYYCHPYAAWERGTVEAINGVIREKFPKGTNFDLVSSKEVSEVEAWINSLPMECHKGYTPAEKFEEQLALAA